jgi:hypothetical protein
MRNARWYQSGIKDQTEACTPTPVARSRRHSRGAAGEVRCEEIAAVVRPAAREQTTLKRTPTSRGEVAVIGAPPSKASNSAGQPARIPAEPLSERIVQTE